MLGKRSDQRGLFEADYLYLDFVGRDSFYGFLASQRGQLFRDEEFAALYVLDNGRHSVPPSLLATALLLQTYDRVSDEDAKEHADFDLRWKVALGIALDERPFAKSTLQVFRAQLILHEEVRAVFKKSLTVARQTGYFKQRKIKVALDTSNILGRGAVKDTYNLLADGIVKLGRVLAEFNGETPDAWAAAHDLSRYFGTSSLKGEAHIDWSDAKERQKFLQSIVADADCLLEMARQTLSTHEAESIEHKKLTEAAELLEQLLLQDITRTPDGICIKDGVSRDRVVSVHDPEMRHGRKSKAKRFDGHKAAVAVDPENQLITAVDVLAGNAPDNEHALELVKQTEENAQVEVDETIGDCAYGDGTTRQAFADAGRKLVAKVPDRPHSGQIPKEDFRIDLKTKTCTCPADQECRTLELIGRRTDRNGESREQLGFKFSPEVCAACARHADCVRAGPGKGRTVSLHPQEALLQEARALQRSEAFGPYRQQRQAAEHRLARLMQLGTRQARYFGRVKTLYQLLMAAAVANLTLVATKVGRMRCRRSRASHSFAPTIGAVALFISAFVLSVTCCLGLTGHGPARRQGFHLGF
ncbi:MAG: IS1182 family transposase [Chloroflexota bacterium]|nr:MAG: IS1182 family transposase [Chloroflexota bacterium]